jgi:hypothetical protein
MSDGASLPQKVTPNLTPPETVVAGRLCTISSSVLHVPYREELSTALLKLQGLENRRDESLLKLESALYRRVGQLTSETSRKELLRIKRLVMKRRRELSLSQVQFLSQDLQGMHQEWRQRASEVEFLTSEIEQLIAAQRLRVRETLFDALANEHFAASLALASPALMRASTAFRHSPSASNARNGYVERGLTRYVCRAATKTSPFARFCVAARIEHVDCDPKITGPRVSIADVVGELDVSTRANKRLGRKLWMSVSAGVTASDFLLVCANETLSPASAVVLQITLAGSERCFDVPMDHDVRKIDLALDLRTPRPVAELAKAITDAGLVDAPLQEVRAYIARAVSRGLLVTANPMRSQDLDWIGTLRESLRRIPTVPSSSALIRLEEVARLEREFPSMLAQTRVEMLQALTPLVADSEGENTGGLRSERRNLIYEDAVTAARICIDRSQFAAILSSFSSWVRVTEPIGTLNAEKSALYRFYIERFGQTQKTPLLEFYHAWRREHGVSVNGSIGGDTEPGRRIAAARARLQRLIREKVHEAAGADEVRICKEDVVSCIPSSVAASAKQGLAVSAFVQLDDASSGNVSALLPNGQYHSGHGKFLSRFLHLLPDLHSVLLERNESFQPEVVELDSDQDFNANLAPNLTRRSICLPNVATTRERTIRLTDLSVAACSSDAERLILIDEREGKEVEPVDVSFMNPRLRPQVFQLLLRFSRAGSFGLDLDGVCSWRRAVAGSINVGYRPRIRFDDHLILARRQWRLASKDLPEVQPGNELAGLRRCSEWAANAGIPQAFFVRLQASRTSSGQGSTAGAIEGSAVETYGDWRKPLYVDIMHPTLRSVLGQVPKIPGVDAVIEECLPVPSSAPRGDDGAAHCVELVIDQFVELDAPR